MSEYNNIYIKRFFILLSSTGEIVCERQYKHASDGDNHGENDHAMDNAILASFASSANNFMKYVMESSISNNLMSKQKGGNSNASNSNNPFDPPAESGLQGGKCGTHKEESAVPTYQLYSYC